RSHRFARYADDLRVHVRSERAGQRVLTGVSEFIEKRLKLKVNRKKSSVRHAAQATVLGFGFVLDQDGQMGIRVDPKALERLRRRLRQLTRRSWSIPMEERIERLNRQITGWCGYFALAETPRVFEDLDKWLRRRLRQVRWKEWKLPKARRRNLRGPGPPRTGGLRMGRQPQRVLASGRYLPVSRSAQQVLGGSRPQTVQPPMAPAPVCLVNRRMRGPHVRWCGRGRGNPALHPIMRSRGSGSTRSGRAAAGR